MALHAVVESLMHAMHEADIPAFSAGSPADARAAMEVMRTAAPVREVAPLAEIRDFDIPGNPPVRVRSYTPLGRSCGTIVYMHGGGWVIGDLETSHPPAAALAAGSDCRVLSVDYRLAPEHPFPAALDDVMHVIAWAAAQGGPVLVAGDSAGGNLAAAAALRTRDASAFALAGQILIYPALDPTLATVSHSENSPLNYILTSEDMRWFWTHYAGSTAFNNALLAPASACCLTGLPAAFVAVASHDVLRDEGVAYAKRLQAAGVETALHLYDGMVHGFLGFLGMVDTAQQALIDMAAWAQFTARSATPSVARS